MLRVKTDHVDVDLTGVEPLVGDVKIVPFSVAARIAVVPIETYVLGTDRNCPRFPPRAQPLTIRASIPSLRHMARTLLDQLEGAEDLDLGPDFPGRRHGE